MSEPYLRVWVVGVGSGGCKAVNRMIEGGVSGVDFLAVDTDARSLALSRAPSTLLIGEGRTRGHGTGGDPAIGAEAAEASSEALFGAFRGADMVWLIAGMGGGTGSGALPVIARITREAWALTLAVVTKPFSSEGSRRRRVADAGIERLRQQVDTLITVDNDRLLEAVQHPARLQPPFPIVDEILHFCVRDVTDLLIEPAIPRVDFADVRTILADGGAGRLAIGQAKGQGRAVAAADLAVGSPLLEAGLGRASGILFSFRGGFDMGLSDVRDAAEIIHRAAHPDARFIFASLLDPSMSDRIRVTVIATGYEESFGKGGTDARGRADRPVHKDR